MKTVYATIKLTVKADADVENITSETEYNFSHPDILDTEWVDTEIKEINDG
jgi:hypothetical protein